jgi:uncharacterized protein YutE (UPF0331/DUF86 family)
MSDLNAALVAARAAEIRENVAKIREYTAVPDEEFWADERYLYSVMHLLLVAIEATAALCSHAVARLARQTPASYAECFETLQSLHVVDDELARRLVLMARFRNILVHRYWEVDDARVLDYARHNLDDFERFLEAYKQLV